jgi:hypothetical protein
MSAPRRVSWRSVTERAAKVVLGYETGVTLADRTRLARGRDERDKTMSAEVYGGGVRVTDGARA